MLPLILIVVIAFIIMRPFKLNEFFILIFGILTPFYLLISYLFLKNELSIFFPQVNNLFNIYSSGKPKINEIITISVTAFITVWAMFKVQQTGSRELIQVRKSWIVVAVFFYIIPAGNNFYS